MLNELRRITILQLLLICAALLTLIAISLSVADIIASSTSATFVFLVVLMIIITLLLVRLAYPRASAFEEVALNPLAEVRGSTLVHDNEAAPSFSELRRILINRVQLRREIKGARWASIKADRKALSHLIGDEDLVDLVMSDGAGIDQRKEDRKRSRERFETILAKVEKWK